MHNRDASKTECRACGLKGHKIKECRTKHLLCKPKENIHIKTRNIGRNTAIWKYQKHYGYEMNDTTVCHTSQKEAVEAFS